MAVLFDTSTIEPGDRAESWSDAHKRAFFPIDVAFADRARSRGRIEGHELGPLGVFRVVSDRSVVRRTPSLIARCDPEQFLIAMSLRGSCVIEQSQRSSRFAGEEPSSWHSSQPFVVDHVEPFDLLLVIVPRTLLGARRDLLLHQTAGRLAAPSRMAAIAGAFLRELWDGLEHGVDRRVADDLADATVALVRALHPATRADACDAQSVPAAALLPRIKAHIDEQLGDPRLGPQSIARAHYISTRYLHKLFAREGLTVSEWVRDRRLERCRRDLRDPALAYQSVSEVARRWGLPNPSHFSRLFRDAYGCTPTELRAAAQRTGSVR